VLVLASTLSVGDAIAAVVKSTYRGAVSREELLFIIGFVTGDLIIALG
jgi:hypothetical protein